MGVYPSLTHSTIIRSIYPSFDRYSWGETNEQKQEDRGRGAGVLESCWWAGDGVAGVYPSPNRSTVLQYYQGDFHISDHQRSRSTGVLLVGWAPRHHP